jgi:hypothetical protein
MQFKGTKNYISTEDLSMAVRLNRRRTESIHDLAGSKRFSILCLAQIVATLCPNRGQRPGMWLGPHCSFRGHVLAFCLGQCIVMLAVLSFGRCCQLTKCKININAGSL